MKEIKPDRRNYTTISPSAKSLLFMKGYTNIPYARKTAELVIFPAEYNPDFSKRDLTFWARILHFENRYWSIDNLLKGLPVKNILELSSGFSFRGLAMAHQKGFHYIDTDLPDIIMTKMGLLPFLLEENNVLDGELELLPLNALNEEQFHEVVSHFPAGEIVIVNEGLLMYLDMEEKEKLCKIIHGILKERGGYWITADVYIKKQFEKLNLKIDQQTIDFFEYHKIEDHKFESFTDAKIFFKQNGFKIDKVGKVDRSSLSSMKYFIKSLSFRQLFHFRKAPKMQATWRLKVTDDNR